MFIVLIQTERNNGRWFTRWVFVWCSWRSMTPCLKVKEEQSSGVNKKWRRRQPTWLHSSPGFSGCWVDHRVLYWSCDGGAL